MVVVLMVFCFSCPDMRARALPGLDCGVTGDEQLRAYLLAVDRLPPLAHHEAHELGEPSSEATKQTTFWMVGAWPAKM
jgi:hypothetical protein